jgi:RHS repeat-associated protein
LDRVTDANGNWIQYSYAAVGNVKYPSEISWAQSGASGNRFVKFLRVARSDVALDFTAGFRQQVDQRLDKIEARMDTSTGPLVTRYQLNYAASPDSGRSLLASVQRFGSNGTTALPPHEFDYSTSSHAFSSLWPPKKFSTIVAPIQSGLEWRHKGVVDVDGDALIDFVNVDQGTDGVPYLTDGQTYWARNQGLYSPNPWWPGESSYIHDYEGNETTYFTLGSNVYPLFSFSWFPCPGSGSSYGCARTGLQFGDVTGDGYADWLNADDPTPPCDWTLRVGTGSGPAATALPWLNTPPHPGVGSGYSIYGECDLSFAYGDPLAPDQLVSLVDLNGDRLPDRVFSNTAGANNWHVALNLGVNSAGTSLSFAAQRVWPAAPGQDIEEVFKAHMVDINGDGLVDRVHRATACDSCAWSVSYNYGAGFDTAEGLTATFSASLYDPNGTWADDRVLRDPRAWGLIVDVLDLNGDGLADRYGFALNGPYAGKALVWFGTGSGFKSSAIEWTNGQGYEVARKDISSYSNLVVEMRDYDGDGLVDRAYNNLNPGYGSVLLNTGPYPDLLDAAATPLRGVIDFDYGAAAQQPNAAGTSANQLPMPRWVVTKTTRWDGRAGTPQVVDEFLYRNAGYDRAEREFRGFGEVTRTARLGPGGPIASEVVSSYQTDRTCAEELAGVVVKSGANTYQQESHTYLPFTPQPSGVPGAKQWTACLPEWSTYTAVEAGTAAARTSRVKREYGANPATTFYNVQVLREYGEWNTTTGQDVPGDERFTFYTYATAIDANYYAVSRPRLIEVQDGAALLASKTQMFYDGRSDTNATKGMPTAVEGWLDVPAPARWVRLQTLAYDAYGNVTSRTGPVTTYDPSGFQQTTAFDTTYRTFPISTTAGPDTATPLATTISYTGCLDGVAPPPGLGLPCSITSPQGGVSDFRYDPLARLDKRTNPSALTEAIAYTLPAPGGPAETRVDRTLSGTGVPAHTYKQFLDGFGRTYREESPGKSTETIVVARTFDARGRLATETIPHFSGTPTPLSRALAYDPLGRTSQITDFDGNTKRVASYRPWEVVEEVYFGTISAANRKFREENAQDGLGRLKEVRDYKDAVNLGTPYTIRASYDAADRLREVRDPIAVNSALCSEYPGGAPCSGQDHVTEIAFDTLGRKLSLADPDAGTWLYEYFDSGKLKKQTNGAGGILEMSYDGLERIVSQNVTPDGNGSADATFAYGTSAGADYGRLKTVDAATDYTYWYDVPGRITTQRQITSALTFNNSYTYDPLDRVKTHVFPDASSFSWTYDATRLTRIAHATATNKVPLSGASYDALGRPTQLKIGGRLISSTEYPAATVDYEFGATTARLSRVLSKRYPSGTATTVMDMTTTFDGLGRLTTQGGTFEGQTINRSYAYDGLGRMTTATGPWQSSSNSTWTHTYDPLGNLRSLSSTTGYTRSWTYGHSVRPRFLTAFSETSGVSDSGMTPEGSGNVASRVRNGVTQSFTWNVQNRLYRITGYHPTETFQLSYDAFGRRVQQQITGGSNPTTIVYVGSDFEYDTALAQANLFFFVGGQRIASLAVPGNLYANGGWSGWWIEVGRRAGPPLGGLVLVLGLAGIGVLATRRRPAWLAATGATFLGAGILVVPIPAIPQGGGSVHGSHTEQTGVYYLPDHLGSTRAVVDVNGSVLETRDYDPWGNSIAHTGTFNLKHRFTGQPIAEVDYASGYGLHNYGARFYDPKWGRFVSSDEMVEGLDSQGINSFAYARSGPTSATDPTGHFAEMSFGNFGFNLSIPASVGAFGGLFGVGTGQSGKVCNEDAPAGCQYEIDDTLLLALPAMAAAEETCGTLCAFALGGLVLVIKISIDAQGKTVVEGLDPPPTDLKASEGTPSSPTEPPQDNEPGGGSKVWKAIIKALELWDSLTGG